MKFCSTRNKNIAVSGTYAVCRGISEEGGLFVPLSYPRISLEEIEKLCELDYPSLAAFVIGKFLPELGGKLSLYTHKAYARFEDEDTVTPLVKLDDKLYLLELWHGPTHAFKDVALTLLPYLLSGSKEIEGDEAITLIPVATSGDTGKAALEGFKDVKGTAVAVFYPDGGVSELQRLQMITTTGGNVFVSAIKGNFDDAQTAVKKALNDRALGERLKGMGVELSSANSINFGRLAPQIAYYFSAYCDLLAGKQIKLGDEVDFVVPSGNFGDILAGYYAYKMGLPVGTLVCASNSNNVLCDFLHTGVYDIRRKFVRTTSPSMDILVSSNLERLIFDAAGCDDKLTTERMEKLKRDGFYEITKAELGKIREKFAAGFCDEDETAETIAEYFDEYGYIIDPHTAVAACVAGKTKGERKSTVILSTASPHKFADVCLRAIGEGAESDEVENLRSLEDITALEVPESLINLPSMEKIFEGSIQVSEVSDVIEKFAAKIANADKAK